MSLESVATGGGGLRREDEQREVSRYMYQGRYAGAEDPIIIVIRPPGGLGTPQLRPPPRTRRSITREAPHLPSRRELGGYEHSQDSLEALFK